MGLRRLVLTAVAVVAAAGMVTGAVSLMDPAAAPGGGRAAVRSPQPVGATRDAAPGTAEVQALLARMSTAVEQGDEEAFLAVVDPAAPQVRIEQRRLFRSLRRLPLATLTYTWPDRRVLDPAAGDRPDDLVAAVERRYWLQGWDDAPVVESRALVFRRSADGWLLAADREGPGGAAPEPWAVGDVAVEQAGPVLLVGDAGTGADLRRLGERISAEIPAVRRLWAGPDDSGWSGRAVVYVVGSGDFLQRWFGELTPSRSAAFDGEVAPVPGVSTGTPVVAGRRMVLSPHVLTYRDAALRALLRHELAHLATLPRRSGDNPAAWLVEGVAEYTAYRGADGRAAADGVAALARRGLPRPMWAQLRRASYRPELELDLEDLYAGDADAVSRRYTDGWLAALYVADRHGEAALRRMLRSVVWAGPGSVVEREAAVLREVLRVDREDFVEDVADYARVIRRRFV